MNRWISEDVWAAARTDIKESEFHGQACFGGFELASQLNLVSWGRLRPRLENGVIHWYFFATNYVNEKLIAGKRTIDEVEADYLGWCAKGCLIGTSGSITDYDQIERDILSFHRHNPFQEIGYDPFSSVSLNNNLISQGVNAVKVPHKSSSFGPAMEWIETLLGEGRFHHDGDAVLQWGVQNVMVRDDSERGLKFPRKIAEYKRIDPAIALIVAAVSAQKFDSKSSIVSLFTAKVPVKNVRPVPPEYVPPPPLEVRWSDQHDRVLKRPVPPDVERPAIKWDDQGSGFCELEKQITILRWYNGFIVVLLIYGLFFK